MAARPIPGTAEQPLRVAIIGAGPTGFYAADQLLRQAGVAVEVDLFDRLPTPFGLVRFGVAPDHQKIKSVTVAFDKVAANPRFRFFGHVEVGKDLSVDDLRRHYHQILYCTGAETDRRMGIPGEDLRGSRGPAQAAFTNPEIKELGELADADITVRPDEAALDELTRAALAQNPDRATTKKVEILQTYAQRPRTGKSKLLVVRFLVSPVELVGDDAGQVAGIRLVHNRLVATPTGTLQARPTGEVEELPVGLVFRAVGYKGVPLPGVPFHETWAVILIEKGRVLDPETKQPIVGEYTAGWIKRGPSGVIGTNKPDAAETVAGMMEDRARDALLRPEKPTRESVERLLRQRQPRYFSYDDWRRLDALEVAAGRRAGRPRAKFTRVGEMARALGRRGE